MKDYNYFKEKIAETEWLEDVLPLIQESKFNPLISMENWTELVSIVSVKFKVKKPSAINAKLQLLDSYILDDPNIK